MNASASRYSMGGHTDLTPFKELLLRTCGHSFENEREQALSEALRRRMTAANIDEFGAYYSIILRDADELCRLTELLTVNETYFFREPEHLNLLMDKLLPELMTARNRKPVRIVSAGCSSGEEPYTIAIMLRERFGIESDRQFAITGVDIDSCVISTAQQGVFGKSSFRGMDPVLKERYFEPAGPDRFRVRDVIRNMVRFEVVNLLGSFYPESMHVPDMILYRNVSIYFPQKVQREIFGRLAEILADGGCLLVGASETFHHDIGLLSLVQQDSLFYYRKTPLVVFDERRAVNRHATPPLASRSKATRTAPVSTVKPEGGTPQSREGLAHPAPRRQPQDVRELFDTAIGLAHANKHDKALAVLDDIIGQDSGFTKAYSLKGSLLLSTSRYAEARQVCETILARDTLCLEAYLMLGMVARQDGDNEEAVRRFREAIYLNASCWPAHFYTAEILFVQQDRKRARSSFEAVLRVLEKGVLKDHGQAFFPLSFNAEQFMVICKHKLSTLKAVA